MEIVKNEFTNNPPKLCCRACLNTDCKLIDIHENKLADVFTCISGTHKLSDGLPQHLCVYCSALLTKVMSFRAMCLRTEQRLMTELLKEGVTLTADYIRNINKPSYQPLRLSFTGVKTIDYVDTPPQCDIKQEPVVDIVDINTIINPDLKTEPKNKKYEVEVKADNTCNVVAVKNVKDKECKKKAEPKAKKCTNIEVVNEEDSDNDYEEDIAISELKIIDNKGKKRKAAVKVKKPKDDSIEKEGNVKGKDASNDVKPVKPKRKRKKKEVTRKFRNPENGFMPVFDFAKVESEFGVRVVTLTKEEQLAEIEDRKSSDNYLSAPFRCEDCGKGFLAEAPYANHRKRHSPSVGPYACEICLVRFRLQCLRQTHQDFHRLKFFCKECSFVSRSRDQARRHHDVHAGKTFECQHCGKTFMKSSTYLSHVRLAHPAMNVACDECGETFVGHRGLRQHKFKMHSENMAPPLKCTTCAATFVSAEALNKHTDTAGDHKGLSPCRQCGENCGSEETLREHVKEKHDAEEHRCEECSQTFTSAASYTLHYQRKHLNQRYSFAGQKKPERRTPGNYVCEQCGKIMLTATRLRYHQRIHQTVKPFACRHCPKTFVRNHVRALHERSHTGERPFQCPLCPLAFALKGNLSRHNKAVHLGLRKNIPCDICGRVFSLGSALRIHINTAHKGMPWPKRARRNKLKKDGE